MKFKRIPLVIEAFQFIRSRKPWPKGVCLCEAGLKATHVHTIHGPVYVTNTDWIVAERDGKHFYPIDNETMQETYKRI